MTELLLSAFRGRVGRFVVLEPSGWRPIHREVGRRDVEDHLAGRVRLGAYPLTKGNRCWFSGVAVTEGDAPSRCDRALRVAIWCECAGLDVLLEGLPGEAASVWLLHDEPVYASVAADFWSFVSERTQVSLGDMWPRPHQPDRVVELPLGGGSCFVDDQGEVLEPEQVLRSARRCSETDLLVTAAEAGRFLPPGPGRANPEAGSTHVAP